MPRKKLAEDRRKGKSLREGQDPRTAGPDREGETVVDARDASRAGASQNGANQNSAYHNGAREAGAGAGTEPGGVRLSVGAGDDRRDGAGAGYDEGNQGEAHGEPWDQQPPTWRGYLRQHPGYLVAATAVVVLAVMALVAVSLGGSGEQQPAGDQQPDAPAAGEPGSGAPAAEEVGEVRQDRDGSTVTVSVAPDGGSYQGELSDEEDSLFVESEQNSTQASFVSPFAEGDERSWLGQIKDSSAENFIVQASQTTDPGPAAAEGRSPFMRGSYTVKARDGSLSASGSFEDVFVTPTKLERTYTETYFASDTGTSTPERREIKVRFETEGDPAFIPTLMGYELPSGQQIGSGEDDAGEGDDGFSEGGSGEGGDGSGDEGSGGDGSSEGGSDGGG